VSDIDTAAVDSLKVLDLKWPIREAYIVSLSQADPAGFLNAHSDYAPGGKTLGIGN